MKFKSQQELFNHYTQRYPYFGQYTLKEGFLPETTLAVVIPCFNEPNLLGTLKSLAQCTPPQNKVEVLVVLNASATAELNKVIQNQKTAFDFKNWVQDHTFEKLNFRWIEALDLPHKKAGVGLARKIGMDEAFRQFAWLEKTGYILNLDADCTVSLNYLTEAENQLTGKERGGHFAFEHPIENVENLRLKTGIINYELHLRYHNQGLISTGFTYAQHTIGSCMIVRSDVYALLGGMNQRKAGEDFYFMNKVYAGGDCATINGAKVFPSARISDRVPFGTGRAQGQWVEQGNAVFYTYNPDIYTSIAEFIFAVKTKNLTAIPNQMSAFLEEQNFYAKLIKLEKRSSNAQVYLKNLFQEVDAFFILKLIHFLRDHFYANVDINWAAAELLGQIKNQKVTSLNTLDLLQCFRDLEIADKKT